MDAVQVQDLTKRYGPTTAVDGVTFAVRSGETFGILGPNGAGKTTTLEIVEGLRRADGGEVTVLGERPWPRNPRLLPRIGVQLQATAFFERLTAREQLVAFARLYGLPAARADAALALVGLTDSRDVRTENLSGGQAQRLSVACAVINDPEVVFLDEPTTGLDPQARRNLWDVITAISGRGHTVVLTTHYLDEAERLCDRVAIMDTGRILALDTPAALVRGLDAPIRVTFPPGALTPGDAGTLPGADAVREDATGLVVETRVPDRTLAAVAERGALNGMTVRGATLEDVFLNLTGREYRE